MVRCRGNVKKENFVGKGYHDHHFGSVPLGQFVKAWHWGRAFLGEETLVYSLQVPPMRKNPPEDFSSPLRAKPKLWQGFLQTFPKPPEFLLASLFQKTGLH